MRDLEGFAYSLRIEPNKIHDFCWENSPTILQPTVCFMRQDLNTEFHSVHDVRYFLVVWDDLLRCMGEKVVKIIVILFLGFPI